jgi:hypothetical protein
VKKLDSNVESCVKYIQQTVKIVAGELCTREEQEDDDAGFLMINHQCLQAHILGGATDCAI